MRGPTIWELLSIINYALVAVAIIAILRRPREPRAMVAWMLALILLPVVGLVLFFLIGQLKIDRTRRRRQSRRQKLAAVLARKPEAGHAAIASLVTDQHMHAVVHIATRFSRSPPSMGNDVTIFHDGEAFFLALRLAIEAARSHVHLEFYIFQPDETGRAVAELLMAKARSGVKCRLLLDAVGCWRLPRSFVRRMREEGVQVGYFNPVIPWRGRFHVNFRNHRKLVVIDGHTGFTGSQNIGDEYRGRLARLGPWRDTIFSVRGPAVGELQDVFLEDWNYATDETLDAADLFPEPSRAGPHAVQIIPSGPDTQADVMHQVLFAAVAAARKSICIATPYFVPDVPMIMALQAAAYRNVKVQLLIPSRSDHWFVLWAGRSYYDELTAAGVEIFEYGLGMLHCKNVVIDESWALAGSANMDARSFRLNFELTAILYDPTLARQLQDEFDELRAASRRFSRTEKHQWTFRESVSIGLARLASPML